MAALARGRCLGARQNENPPSNPPLGGIGRGKAGLEGAYPPLCCFASTGGGLEEGRKEAKPLASFSKEPFFPLRGGIRREEEACRGRDL